MGVLILGTKKLLTTLICVLMVFLPTFAQLYINKWNLFAGGFTEVIERVYIVFYNGDVYSFTTHDANEIDIPIDFMREILNREGKKVKNIAIVIHNHFAQPFFSEDDLKVLRYLKTYGFSGAFLIYVQSTGKIIIHKDNKVKFRKEFIKWIMTDEVQEFFNKFETIYPEAYKELLIFLKEQMK